VRTRRGTLQRDADAIDATSACRWPCLVDAVDVVPRRYLNTGFRVEATGRDAELLRILRERWGEELVFEHSDSSVRGHINGRFRAPAFMDRGETYFSIDHVALGCVRRDGVLYRIVGVRGLLPQDMNNHASGYEFIKVLGLEAWVEEYRKNAYCEVGVGDLDASEAVFDYRPQPLARAAIRRGG
jgi:hypothetical protein